MTIMDKQPGVVAEEAELRVLPRPGRFIQTMRGFARKLHEIFTLRVNAQFYATLCAYCMYTLDRSKHRIQHR